MRRCSESSAFVLQLPETSPLAQIMLPGAEVAAAVLSHYLSAQPENAPAIFVGADRMKAQPADILVDSFDLRSRAEQKLFSKQMPWYLAASAVAQVGGWTVGVCNWS